MERMNSYLSNEEVEFIKQKLLADKERICNKAKNADHYCLDKNELSDPLDEASINIQTSHELRFRNRENFYLKKINKSLTKLENGTYGLCSDCDAEISFDRLKARPTAELCISCKEEAEVYEQNNYFEKKSKSLGRSLSDMAKR